MPLIGICHGTLLLRPSGKYLMPSTAPSPEQKLRLLTYFVNAPFEVDVDIYFE
jgi:hypothetical protein